MTALKTIFRSALFLLVPVAVAAQDTAVFVHGAWKDAMIMAKQQNKPVFVDLWFLGCMPCKRMVDETFAQKDVAAYMNANFICYKSDINVEMDGKLLSRKYGASGFPHYLYINPDGSLIEAGSGFMGAPRFLENLKTVVANGKAGKVKKFSNSMDITYPEVYNDLYFKKPTEQSPNRKELINKWMAEQKDLSSELSYLMMVRGFGALDEQYASYFIDHAVELANAYGARQVGTTVYTRLSKKAGELGSKKDKAAFEALVAKVKPVYDAHDWKIFGKIISEAYYKNTGDYSVYANFIETSGFYTLADKASFAGKTAELVKGNKALLARLDSWMSENEINNQSKYALEGLYYTKAVVKYFLDNNEEAKKYLEAANKAALSPKSANREGIDGLSVALGAGKKDFSPKAPYVMVPLTMD
ncbi:DUF255 domain-containing protein [uncultured Chitinophaga sp.]|uniref:thioredoxin family protein n=1 Tax=uncultured Chitinophaga sp. TaxID=339340 RepID=UPI0025F9803C|nr:DUF255 domain-containing protein [uncultured Chitinophaga sp.]